MTSTIKAPDRSQPVTGAETKSRHILTMAGLMLVAAIPRLYDLGNPGLTQNEDYVMLCARAILDHGAPFLPSGHFYPRALPFSYASALLVFLLGPIEIAVRLLPALFSIATVGLGFVFASRAFGRAAGMIAGLAIALSSWEIMFGRTARMYSALSFFFLLALYGTYRVAFEGSKRWRVPAMAAGIMACLLHQLGALLVVPYAVLLLLGRPVRHKFFVGLSIALVASTAVGAIAFENSVYTGFRLRVAGVRTADRPGAPLTLPGSGELADDESVPKQLKTRSLPDIGFKAALLAVGVSVAAAGAALRLGGDRWYALAVAVAALLVSFQQGMLASYAAAAYLVLALLAGRPPGVRKTLGLAAVVAAGAVAWLTAAVVSGGAARAPSALRNLIEYPPNFLEFYARLYPGMFLVVAGAVLFVVVQFARDRVAFAPHVFVTSCFVLPAISLGFHPSAPKLFTERYVFHLDTCFLLLYAFGVWHLAEWFTTKSGLASGGARRRTVAALAATIVLLVTGGLAPAKIWAAARQNYGENQQFQGLWGESRFVADHQGSSQYVCEHAGPDDLVVPMDVLNHWAYCPRADYQLTLSTKGDAEGWIGIRSGDSIERIGRVFLRGNAPQVWVVLSGYETSRARKDPRLETMLAFRKWDCARRAYEGRDGESDVWLIDRACLDQHLP